MLIILLVLLIHVQHDFFEEKNCVGEEPWGVTTLITGHYHPWGEVIKNLKKKEKESLFRQGLRFL